MAIITVDVLDRDSKAGLPPLQWRHPLRLHVHTVCVWVSVCVILTLKEWWVSSLFISDNLAIGKKGEEIKTINTTCTMYRTTYTCEWWPHQDSVTLLKIIDYLLELLVWRFPIRTSDRLSFYSIIITNDEKWKQLKLMTYIGRWIIGRGVRGGATTCVIRQTPSSLVPHCRLWLLLTGLKKKRYMLPWWLEIVGMATRGIPFSVWKS